MSFLCHAYKTQSLLGNKGSEKYTLDDRTTTDVTKQNKKPLFKFYLGGAWKTVAFLSI